MRINVYAEELTDEIELVDKHIDARDVTFHGVRVYLASPDELHHTDDDDDRSAITLWVPWTKAGGHDFGAVIDVLHKMAGYLSEAWRQDQSEQLARRRRKGVSS